MYPRCSVAVGKVRGGRPKLARGHREPPLSDSRVSKQMQAPAPIAADRPISLSKTMTQGSASRSTPYGYKTPDNKVSEEVEVINNRLSGIYCSDVFTLNFLLKYDSDLPVYMHVASKMCA